MMRHNNNTMSCHSIIYMNLLIFILKIKTCKKKKCIYFPLFRRFFILLLPSSSSIVFRNHIHCNSFSLSLYELDSFITCGDPCPVRDE